MAGYTETERLEVLEFLDEEGLLESYDNPILKYFLLAHLKFLLQWR